MPLKAVLREQRLDELKVRRLRDVLVPLAKARTKLLLLLAGFPLRGQLVAAAHRVSELVALLAPERPLAKLVGPR